MRTPKESGNRSAKANGLEKWYWNIHFTALRKVKVITLSMKNSSCLVKMSYHAPRMCGTATASKDRCLGNYKVIEAIKILVYLRKMRGTIQFEWRSRDKKIFPHDTGFF